MRYYTCEPRWIKKGTTTALSPSARVSLFYTSRFGEMRIDASQDGLSGVYFVGQKWEPEFSPSQLNSAQTQKAMHLAQEAKEQLEQFFAGERYAFNLPLVSQGTAFQRAVWQQISCIPFGQTLSYGAIAQRLGTPDAARAVGAATGKNPWTILVPCHRVMGASGAITGYAGGVERKRRLLDWEQSISIEAGNGSLRSFFGSFSGS